MNCNSCEALFERWLDGTLEASGRAAVHTHIARCGACRSILEELEAVDAVLHAPREVELAANFTSLTMAEAQALPPPANRVVPVRAYVVSYLAGAWMIAGAGFIFAPQTMHAVTGTTIDISRNVADAVVGLGAVISRALGRGGSSLGAILAALGALDVVLVVAFGAALKFARPRLVERLRS